MNPKCFTLFTVVILVIAVTSPLAVFAQGDGRSLDRAVLDKWCTDHGYVGVEVDGSQNNVFGLGCKDRAGKLYGLDMIAICTSVYGSAWATPQYSDFNNPNSWRCYPTQGPAPTVAPQPQAPSGGTGSSGGQSSGGGNTNVNPTPVTSSGGNSGGGGNPTPGYVDPYQGQGSSGNTDCPSVPSRLSSGQSAWVSDYDPYPLKVFAGQSFTAQRLPGVPIRQTVTIMGGPECHGGRVWVFISYQGRTGWTIEVNRNNTYNLIPGTYGGGEEWARIHPADAVYIPHPIVCAPEGAHAWVQFSIPGAIFRYEGMRLESTSSYGKTLAAHSQLLWEDPNTNPRVIRMGLSCWDIFMHSPYQALVLSNPDKWKLVYRVR